ncbi:MAG: hypothetical protein Q4G30_00215 [Actinomycetaceae bacterium]|nr:hypothetical protein [Actinomycetaceae bacterium]
MRFVLLALASPAILMAGYPFAGDPVCTGTFDSQTSYSVERDSASTVEIRVTNEASVPGWNNPAADVPSVPPLGNPGGHLGAAHENPIEVRGGPRLCDSSFGDSHPGRLGFCLADFNRDGDSEEDDEGSSGLVVTASDVQSLGVANPQLGSSPPVEKRDWVLVNMETIAYTTSTSQTLQGEVLGVPITVTLQAIDYRWDWGDGSVTHTTHPGAPWPDMSNHHFYRTRGHAAITLTTTWAGTWVAATGQSGKVLGTLETSTTSPRFEIRDWIPYLVAPER